MFTVGYSVLRHDRNFVTTNRTTGGGVLIALKNNITYKIVDLSNIYLQIPLIDVILCKCTINSYVFYILALYIPPDISTNELEAFFELIEIHIFDKNIIVIGDFNIPNFYNASVVHNCPKRNALDNFLQIMQIKQHNMVTNAHNKILDLVLSNINGNVCVERDDCGFVPEDLHHPVLSILLNIPLKGIEPIVFPCNTNIRYNFKKGNYTQLYSDLLHIDWSVLNSCTNVDDACTQFYNILYEALNKSIPLIRSTNKSKYPKWFTQEIIRNVKMKKYFHNKWKCTGSIFYHNEFKRMRRHVKYLTSVSYRHYMREIESNIKHNPNQLWKFINERTGTTRIPGELNDSDDTYSSPQDIVSAFAKIFSDSFVSEVINEPTYNVSYCENLNLPTVEESDVLNSINHLKSSKVSGDDQIPSFLIKDCKHIFIQPLSLIFNLSLRYKTFPSVWKCAVISPVFKRGDKTNIRNYRPIAILSNFSKIFEHLIYNTIYCHVKKYISPQQHGFFQGRSTTTNLATISQHLCEVLDNRGQADVIYTDFSQAFDRINHQILLQKLNSFGLCPAFILFIKSYLYNRSNYVYYNGYKSYYFYSLSGVPQGSNLGPLLFNIYIDDLIRSLTCPALAYADDLKIYCTVNNESNCRELQDNLNLIVNWCNTNKIYLNVPKCVILTYTRKKQFITYNYMINDTTLARNTTIKDLGVIFDSNLTFIHHINSISSAAFRMLGFIMRSSKYFHNINLLKILYFAFVRSKLEYASIIWYPYYTSHSLTIERVQKRFLKYLNFKATGTYNDPSINYDNLLSKFNVVSLFQRRKKCSGLFMVKLIDGSIDSPQLLSQVQFNIPRISSRNSNTFFVPTAKTNILLRSPIIHMCTNANIMFNDIFVGD